MTSIIPPKKSAHECKVCVNRSILHSLLADDVPSSSSTKNLLVGAIDQGTSSSRFLLVASNGRILSTAQIEFDQIFPSNDCGNDDYATAGSSRAGWHEHDPFDVWDSVSTCISRTVEELALLGLDLTTSSSCGATTTTTTTTTTTSEVDNGRSNVRIVSVGITNQRETTVCWNDRTGRVYHNAIVWDDTRTASVAESIIAENAKQIKKMTKTTTTDAGDDDDDAHEGGGRRRNDGMDALRCKTGLPIASYFSGTKVRWLIDNVTKLRYDLLSETERHHVRFGTVDTWLLYMLTGYQRSVMEMEGNERLAHEGGEYKTDVTNASRWLFMNLDTLDWDEGLVAAVCGSGNGGGRGGDATTTTIPMATALPKIVPSSDGTIGTVRGIPCPNMPNNTLALKNVVIGSILGDQQAALFGQSCFRPGEAKCTYGTGLFLMMNTGMERTSSTRGLLTTVAYQIAGDKAVYALEGSVAFSGSTIGWLRDRIELIKSASETESLALSVPSNDGMYLVPAFSGLFAPHWRPDARGCMVGLTASHTKAHIVRAALESSAYQAREVFDAMVLDSDVHLKEMRVDGGATANRFLMQFQSDVLGVPVIRPEFLETTGMGAAFAAGLAVNVLGGLDDIGRMWQADRVWRPTMVDVEREKLWKGWTKAVQRSLNWIDED